MPIPGACLYVDGELPLVGVALDPLSAALHVNLRLGPHEVHLPPVHSKHR